MKLLVDDHIDMVAGARQKVSANAYRVGHEAGNRAFNALLKAKFGSSFRDFFSGYRVLSRRYVKSFPAMSDGFEIEMNVHAMLLRLLVREIDCNYGDRIKGGRSKLHPLSDGTRIFLTMLNLVRLHRPLLFFLITATALLSCSLDLFIPIFVTYLDSGLAPRFPTLIVSETLGLSGLMAGFVGLILDSNARTQIEIRRLLHLNTRDSHVDALVDHDVSGDEASS